MTVPELRQKGDDTDKPGLDIGNKPMQVKGRLSLFQTLQKSAVTQGCFQWLLSW